MNDKPSRATYLICLALLLLSSGVTSMADDPIELSLKDLKITSSNVETTEETGLMLKVVSTGEEDGLTPLFEIEDPSVTGESYAIMGELSCRGVEKKGYLEMWNHLPLKAGESEIGVSFFSRTLGTSGPMKSLFGDEDWRPFVLPANINDGSGRKPLKLTINAMLPGGGTVELRNLKLRPSLGTASVDSKMLRAVIITACATSAIWALAFAVSHWRKKHQENELNRIQNIDAV
ncbi:MAG: hypothetical protein AAF357_13670 [Verrucomicrobiota bacterium]